VPRSQANWIELLTTQTGSQQEAFRNSFVQIAGAEEWGLDVVWIAAIHMNPPGSLQGGDEVLSA
jgi:hypothetical protein